MYTLKPFILFNLFLRQALFLDSKGILFKSGNTTRSISLTHITRVELKHFSFFDSVIISTPNIYITLRFLNKKSVNGFILALAKVIKNYYVKNLQKYGMDDIEQDFNGLLSSDKYVARYDIRQLGLKYAKLNEHCASLASDACFNVFKDKDLIRRINRIMDIAGCADNVLKAVSERNERFIEEEIVHYADFFRTFGGYPYSKEQQRAIIINEDRNLLIAAAGSGKTSTLVGKIGYIILKGICEPTDILPLVFNSSVREEIKNKISGINAIKGVSRNVHTFHSYGKKMLGSGVKVESKTDYVIAKIIDDLKSRDTGFLRDYINFVTVYAKDVIDKYSYEDYKKYAAEVKRDRKLFRDKTHFKTIKGECVRSYEELSIANFLFINGINYIYERHYPFDVISEEGESVSYVPDFYYPDINIYHEHFAVDGNGRSVFGEKYLKDMNIKRNVHKRNGTELFETTSAMFKTGKVFFLIRNFLESKGLVLKLMSVKEINAAIAKSEESGRFSEIILSFLKNFKEKGLSYKDIDKKIAGMPVGYKRDRATLFFSIFKYVYDRYKNYLESNSLIDYQDMIIKAVPLINGDNSKYKFLLVDEFQDVSLGRANMIKALLASNPEIKLFAVGDDYQAINGFAGSDIKYMYEFEKEFASGSGSSTNYLTKTYRCSKGIIDVSSRFISKNPNQIRKNIVAGNGHTEDSFIVKSYNDENHLFETVEGDMENIIKTGNKVVFLANRYHRKYERKKDSIYGDRVSGIITKYNGAVKGETIHYYKGLESDYVFLLMADKGVIPSEIVNDSILSLVAYGIEDFPFAEERRLFYVAVTRAKKGVYLYCKSSGRSSFVDEIMEDFKDSKTIRFAV